MECTWFGLAFIAVILHEIIIIDKINLTKF